MLEDSSPLRRVFKSLRRVEREEAAFEDVDEDDSRVSSLSTASEPQQNALSKSDEEMGATKPSSDTSAKREDDARRGYSFLQLVCWFSLCLMASAMVALLVVMGLMFYGGSKEDSQEVNSVQGKALETKVPTSTTAGLNAVSENLPPPPINLSDLCSFASKRDECKATCSKALCCFVPCWSLISCHERDECNVYLEACPSWQLEDEEEECRKRRKGTDGHSWWI